MVVFAQLLELFYGDFLVFVVLAYLVSHNDWSSEESHMLSCRIIAQVHMIVVPAHYVRQYGLGNHRHVVSDFSTRQQKFLDHFQQLERIQYGSEASLQFNLDSRPQLFSVLLLCNISVTLI